MPLPEKLPWRLVMNRIEMVKKRKAYGELSPDTREELLQRRRQRTALKPSFRSTEDRMPDDIGAPSSHSDRNSKRRKIYAEMPIDQKQKLLKRKREEAALRRSSKKIVHQQYEPVNADDGAHAQTLTSSSSDDDILLIESFGFSDQHIRNLRARCGGPPSSHSDRNSERRKTYAEMPIDQKQKLLKRKREQAAFRRSSKKIVHQQFNADDGAHAQTLTSLSSDDDILLIESFGFSEQHIRNLRACCGGSKSKAKTSLHGHLSSDAFLQAESSSCHSRMPIISSTVVDNMRDGKLPHTCPGSPKKRKYKNIALGNDVPTSAQTLPVVADCVHCKAKRFKGESNLFCCSGGEIFLPSVTMPSQLRDLFVGQTPQAAHFRKNVRTYNNNLAFTTLSAGYDRSLTSNAGGIYTFKVHGQMYHYLKPLKGPDGVEPAGIQLYFYDTEFELEKRMGSHCADKFDEPTMKLLMDILRDNPYCQFFKHLKYVNSLETKKIVLSADPKLDQRRYNIPTASQVGSIFVEPFEEDVERTVPIQVYSSNGKIFRIKHYYGCYDPMQYPLIFPRGQSGWHLNIKRIRKRHRLREDSVAKMLIFDCPESLIDSESKVVRDGKKNKDAVTAREYYCYKLQMRPDDESMFLHVGRLLQQFVVDAYIKIETSRLEFLRDKQGQFRTEMAQGIVDGMDVGLIEGSALGRRVVLPATFIGGPRDMRRRYLDAMAIVQKFGKPDIFLTMTCNPYWPEIQENLYSGEVANDRPDLLARVFRAKVHQLKDDIVDKEIFGAVQSLVYVIEYQKRGLPHCHMLIILKPGCKPLGPDAYDRIVCAELPDPEKQPHLFRIVSKNMMHGPCGRLNPRSPCMKNGKCKFGFPKPFRQSTYHAEDGYPLYRRRDDGRTVTIKKHALGNEWLVGYNKYLSATYDCHINVEICSTFRLIKYVHKYIFKGSDRVGFALQGNQEDTVIDEIKLYQDGRWIGPSEATWRIYGFKLNHMNPAVYSLQVHLPGQQYITFHKNASLESIAANEFLARTTLTCFFKMNEYDSSAKELNLLYKEFPEHFVWSTLKRTWTKRKAKNVIGRLVAVSPREGERYYLRLLLSHIRSPTSYADLRTVQGSEYSTYREAAIAYGLLNSDTYIEDALQEACSFQMPSSLRSFFAILLVFCSPNDPKELWLRFRHELCSDFLKQSATQPHLTNGFIDRKVLNIINGFLLEMGKDIEHYGLMDDIACKSTDELLTREILSEKNIEISDEELHLPGLLNVEQRVAYDRIMQSVMANTRKSFFIDGPGGTGKTFLYRALLATLRSKGHIALAVASSGVAASVLPGGRTAHSRFKFPLDSSDNEVCQLSKQSGLAKLIIQAKLILWDEATMAKRQSLEALDMLLKDLMDSNAPFGGKVVLLGGDFRQTLPVIPGASRDVTVQASIVYSRLWPELEKLNLQQNMRASNDPDFCSFLLRIGEGTEHIDDNEEVELPAHIIIPYIGKEQSIQNLIQCVFADLTAYALNPIGMIGRCVLAATNAAVDSINAFLIECFPGSPTLYVSTDRTLSENEQSDHEDFLNTLNPKGVPAHKLVLKPNCPIMLMRNLNPTEGLCNGTRLICRELCQSTIRAEIAFGLFKGKHVFIPRIPIICDQGSKTSIPFKRFQFPVKLCFAMTINKSQGQTLDFVGLYLEQPVFSHGQLYVALSRAKTSKSVKVLLTPPTFEEARINNKTKNIVFKEIFERQ